MAEARSDRWRTLVNAANAWQASAAEHLPERETDKAAVAACLSDLRQWEDFFAYPGGALLRKLDDRIASGDAMGTARLIQQISAAISSHSYRGNVGDWETGDDSPNVVAEVVKGLGQEGAVHKPYFEVLMVTPGGPAARAQSAQELRKLRRQQDQFVYEPVMVGSFEDAVLGVILNGSVQAVVIYDSIPFASVHNSPVLREVLTDHLGAAAIKKGTAGLRDRTRSGPEAHPSGTGHLPAERPRRWKRPRAIRRPNASGGSSTRSRNRWKST